MTKFFIVAASMFTVIAGPALAKEGRPAAPTMSEAAASDSTEMPRATQRAQRYCVVETPTGSHIPRKTCNTRDAWLEQGFDPLAK